MAYVHFIRALLPSKHECATTTALQNLAKKKKSKRNIKQCSIPSHNVSFFLTLRSMC